YLGPGWYVVHAKVTNNSGLVINGLNLRAYFYDKAGNIIGSGLADAQLTATGELKPLQPGEQRPVDIQVQLTTGPAPNINTPTPAPVTAYDHYEVKVIFASPLPTPTPKL